MTNKKLLTTDQKLDYLIKQVENIDNQTTELTKDMKHVKRNTSDTLILVREVLETCAPQREVDVLAKRVTALEQS